MRFLMIAALLPLATGPFAPAPEPVFSFEEPIVALACNDCGSCGFSEHMMYSSPIEDPTHEGSIESCRNGGCVLHDRCFAEQDQDADMAALALEAGTIGESVRMAILVSDFGKLRDALAHPMVELNADRGAVQVIGCSDRVVASFPVDASLASAAQRP